MGGDALSDPRFSIIPADAVLDKRLEPRDLQVLCIFGKHTDKRGWCRRSQVVMAKEIGCARSTVQASIDRLIDAGWLQKRPQNDIHTPGVRDSAHEYRVVLDVPDQTPDVVESLPTDRHPLPTDRHPLPTHRSAPPADIEIGTYVNEPLLTNPSLTKGASERVSFDEIWKVFPHRPMPNRTEAEKAYGILSDAETHRVLVAAKRYAQWHIEDSSARKVDQALQLEYRIGLGKWLRGAWVEALSIPLLADPIPTVAGDLIALPPDHPDFKAVERMLGKKLLVGDRGKRTFRLAEIEQARQSQGASVTPNPTASPARAAMEAR